MAKKARSARPKSSKPSPAQIAARKAGAIRLKALAKSRRSPPTASKVKPARRVKRQKTSVRASKGAMTLAELQGTPAVWRRGVIVARVPSPPGNSPIKPTGLW